MDEQNMPQGDDQSVVQPGMDGQMPVEGEAMPAEGEAAPQGEEPAAE